MASLYIYVTLFTMCSQDLQSGHDSLWGTNDFIRDLFEKTSESVWDFIFWRCYIYWFQRRSRWNCNFKSLRIIEKLNAILKVLITIWDILRNLKYCPVLYCLGICYHFKLLSTLTSTFITAKLIIVFYWNSFQYVPWFFWVVPSCRHWRWKQHVPSKQCYQHISLHSVISKILHNLNVPYLPWVHLHALQGRWTTEDERLAAHNTFKYAAVVYTNSINI